MDSAYQLQDVMLSIWEAHLRLIVCKDLELMYIYVLNILILKETITQHFVFKLYFAMFILYSQD